MVTNNQSGQTMVGLLTTSQDKDGRPTNNQSGQAMVGLLSTSQDSPHLKGKKSCHPQGYDPGPSDITLENKC